MPPESKGMIFYDEMINRLLSKIGGDHDVPLDEADGARSASTIAEGRI